MKANHTNQRLAAARARVTETVTPAKNIKTNRPCLPAATRPKTGPTPRTVDPADAARERYVRAVETSAPESIRVALLAEWRALVMRAPTKRTHRVDVKPDGIDWAPREATRNAHNTDTAQHSGAAWGGAA